MQQNPLVSILTPMYNTEKYVHRLLDSVLAQDYPAIEMIVIDDGSTDGSRTVVEGYVDRFAAKGYTLRCVHQANAGQSVAIRNGLPLVTGEYLATAPPEFQLVRTQSRYVQDPTLELSRLAGADAREEEDPSLFEDCLYSINGFYFTSGAFLVRTAVLKEVTGGFDIYTEKNAGQNWQLLVPVLYRYRCKTILEPLFNAVERATSHSRGQYSGYEREVVKKQTYLRTQMATVERIEDIPEEKLAHYLKRLQAISDERMLGMALHLNHRAGALEWLPQCKEDMGKWEYRAKNFCLHLPGGTYLLNAYKDLHHRMHLLKKSLKKRP